MTDPRSSARLLTDDEVFGPAPAGVPRLLTDDEVFGPESSAAGPPAPPAPTDTSWTSALRYGAGNVTSGVGATARVLGNRFDNETLRQAGEAASGAIPADPNYRPATPEFVEGLRNFDRRALTNLPRAIVETLPGVAGSVIAGAGAAAVGGPVVGFLGAGALGAAQQFGQTAEARARNNGTAQPTDTDLLAAGGTAAVSGALDAVGARGLGGRAASTLAPSGVLPRVGAAAGAAGREAITEAGQDAVEQAGASAGTANGPGWDPAQTAGAGILGAGARAAMGTPGAVLRGSVESVAQSGADRAIRDASPQQAASYVRVNDLLEERFAQAQDLTGRVPAAEDVLNGARIEIDQQIESLIRQAADRGWIDSKVERPALEGVFTNARRHNQELIDGVPTTDDGIATGLATLDTLENAPAVFRENMRALFTDLNTLAHASRRKNLTGPFESAGKAIGTVAGIAGGAAAGGPGGAMASALTALGGSSVGARAGAYLGRKVDRVAGTHKPLVVLAQRRARKILADAGITDVDATRQMAGELQRVLSDDRIAARAAMGLPTDPETMGRMAAEAAMKRLDREASKQAAADADEAWALIERRQRDERVKAKQIDDAWAQHQQASRPAGATPKQIEALLAAERRAASRAKAADVKSAPLNADEDVQVRRRVAAQTASETAGWEAQLAELARRRAASAKRLHANEQEADRGVQQDEQTLAARSEQDAAEKARQIEQAYAQRDQVSTRQARLEAAIAATRAAEQEANASQLAASAPEADPNLDAVTRQQIAEWEATLAGATKAAQARGKAAATAAAAPEAAPGAPAAVPAAIARATRTARKSRPVEKPVQAPVEASEPLPAPTAPELRQAPSPAAPEAPDVTLSSRSTENHSGPLTGWRVYVQKAIRTKGENVTRAEMDAVVRDMEARGDIESDVAEVILSGRGVKIPQGTISQIIGEVAQKQGWSFEDTPDAVFTRSAGPARGYHRADVRDPASWDGAASGRQAHIELFSQEALRRGEDALAGVLGMFRTNTDKQLPMDARKKIAQAIIRSAPDEATRTFRSSALNPLLKGTLDEDAPAPTPQDTTVEFRGQRLEATDEVLAQAEALMDDTRSRLNSSVMNGADPARVDAQIARAEAKLEEVRAANAAWRQMNQGAR